MADRFTTEPAAEPSPQAAERAIAYLSELQPDLRAAAVADSAGSVIAADGQAEDWEGPLRSLMVDSGFDAVAGTTVHIATAGGEVFLVGAGGVAMAAVADRFVLASLLIHDMRMTLRDLREHT